MLSPNNPEEGGAAADSYLQPGTIDWDEAIDYANDVISGVDPADESEPVFVDGRLLNAAQQLFDNPEQFHDFVVEEAIKASLSRMDDMGPPPAGLVSAWPRAEDAITTSEDSPVKPLSPVRYMDMLMLEMRNESPRLLNLLRRSAKLAGGTLALAGFYPYLKYGMAGGDMELVVGQLSIENSFNWAKIAAGGLCFAAAERYFRPRKQN